MTTVHRELPGFKAFRQFCGRHDTCAQDAATSVLASLDPAHWTADCTGMNHMVNDMLANGRLAGGGTTMASLVAQLSDYGYPVQYDPWMHWHSALNLDSLHALLIADAGIEGIVVQVGQAHYLPYNEQGVFSHFVGVGGIDSAQGYLVANGDIPAAYFRGALWIGWAALAKAVPTAVCVIRRKAAPVSIKDELKAAGWSDSGDWDENNSNGILSCPNGFNFRKGFRYRRLTDSSLTPDDFATMNEASDGSVSAQTSVKHEYLWSQTGGLVVRDLSPAGRVLAFVMSQPHPGVGPTQKQLDAEKFVVGLSALLKEYAA